MPTMSPPAKTVRSSGPRPGAGVVARTSAAGRRVFSSATGSGTGAETRSSAGLDMVMSWSQQRRLQCGSDAARHQRVACPILDLGRLEGDQVVAGLERALR